MGTFASTLQYMAPEQLDGRRADARSDIFAPGVVICEMATSARAFAGSSTMALASANLHNQPPPIGSLQPDSPRGLDRQVRACIAKDPGDRWQTAHDVGLQLAATSKSDRSRFLGSIARRRTRFG